jgi:NTE family protein
MLQALVEGGVRPDLLIGTSVGAVNSAWMAGCPDLDGACQLREIWLELRRDHVFPISAWVGARGLLGRSNHVIPNGNLRKLLERHIAYARLEDAVVPLHIVTTELKTGRACVISSGPAVPALLASTAIPGVFPPVTIGRRTLVDGGVANHTPVATAIEIGASRIYVLPVGYPWLNQEPSNALGMALHALARFVEQKLDAEVEANKQLAEIHVLPTLDLPAVSPADFSRSKELIEKGYASAMRYLGAAPARNAAAQPDGPAEAGKHLDLAPSPARAA